VADDVEVKFGANTKGVDQGVAHVEKELVVLNRSVKAVTNTFAALGTTIVGVFSLQAGIQMVTSLGEIGETAERTSEMLGLTVEQVTALQYATIISGQGAEQMTSIMERLARTMDNAASGGKAQIAAFKEAGVSFKDAAGNLRPLNDVIYDIADSFAGARNGAEKTALAMELMGRSGAEAIPLLNGGSAGLRQFAEEGRKAGVVLSAQMAHAMGETGDKIDDLSQSLAGLAIRIFSQMKPAIDAAIDAMRSFIQSIDAKQIASALNSIVDIVVMVMTKIAEMSAIVQKALNDAGTRADYINNLGLKAFASGATAVMHQQIDSMNAETDEGLKKNLAMFGAWRAQVKSLIGGGGNSSGSPDDRDAVSTDKKNLPGSGLPTFTPPGAPAGDSEKQVQKQIEAVRTLTEGYQIQMHTLNMTTEAATAYEQEQKVLNLAAANNVVLTAKQTAELKKYAAEAGRAAQQLEYMTAVQNEMRGIAQGITSAFGEWMNGTDNLGHALLKMTLQLAEAVAEALLLDIILSAMGLALPASGMGAVLAPLFGGGKADGGPLTAGKWYMAGENGPEPIWGGGVGAEAAGYGAGANMGPSASEIAAEIAAALQPHFNQNNYTARMTTRTIQDLGRRVRK